MALLGLCLELSFSEMKKDNFSTLTGFSKAHFLHATCCSHSQSGCILVYYRKCVLYCAWGALGETERRNWRHHCRCALKLAMSLHFALPLKLAISLHFALPKIHTIGDEFTLYLAKNSHFSFLPSHFPSLPSLNGHHCGAETESQWVHIPLPIHFSLFVPTLSNGASRATRDRKPKTNDQILPSPLNTKTYWK